MPNGGITKETFEQSSTDSKLSILFDQQHEMMSSIRTLQNNSSCWDQWQSCDQRFKKLERSWYKLAGALLLIAAVAPIISTFFIHWFLG